MRKKTAEIEKYTGKKMVKNSELLQSELDVRHVNNNSGTTYSRSVIVLGGIRDNYFDLETRYFWSSKQVIKCSQRQ